MYVCLASNWADSFADKL